MRDPGIPVLYKNLDKCKKELEKEILKSEKSYVYSDGEKCDSLLYDEYHGVPNPWDSITEFALYTGWRAGNILKLCIEDVEEIPDRHNSKDPSAKVILRNMKGGRTEVFPLSDVALELVKHNCKGLCTGSVFVNPRTDNAYNNVSESFYKAVRRLRLTVEVNGENSTAFS